MALTNHEKNYFSMVKQTNIIFHDDRKISRHKIMIENFLSHIYCFASYLDSKYRFKLNEITLNNIYYVQPTIHLLEGILVCIDYEAETNNILGCENENTCTFILCCWEKII